MRQSKRTGGGGLGEKGVGGVRKEGEETGEEVGVLKRVGKGGRGGNSGKLRNNAQVSQTTRAKSRLKGGSQ